MHLTGSGPVGMDSSSRSAAETTTSKLIVPMKSLGFLLGSVYPSSPAPGAMGMVPGSRLEIVGLEFAEIVCIQNARASLIRCAALWWRPSPNRVLNPGLPSLCLAAQLAP